ncbi:UvrD-helicase domain-containing protein [Streptomyces sp. NPDC005133]
MSAPELVASTPVARGPRDNIDLEQLREAARAAQRMLVNLPCGPGRIVQVEACPGAGKTRTIIDRHLNRPIGPRQGRAVVSFTKAAAAEVAQRCAQEGRPELAEYPYFIGTFDRFLWTHVVRPHIRSRDGQRWRRLESWNDHPKARTGGISLEDFHFTLAPGELARIANPKWKKIPHWLADDPERTNNLLHWARNQMSRLWAEGFIAGEQLRDIALYMLSDTRRGPRIAALLASRFAEIIVDESQDLSSEDRSILGLLSDRSVPLLTVGDPDQRIYGFREPGANAGVPVASIPLPPADQRLSHNWRSTQIICDLARTLRPSSAPADIAVGDHHGEYNPVLLLGTSRSGTGEALRQFEEEADRLGIRDPAQRMVLAYSRATLSSAFTSVKEDPPSSQLGALVWATAILRNPGVERKQRERAEKIFSEAIRHHWLGGVDVPETEHLERHGLTALELRAASQILLHSLPALEQPAGDWSRSAFQALSALPLGEGREPVVNRAFSCTSAKKSKPALQLAGAGRKQHAQVRSLHSNTIHGVKGEQFDAVLVLLPSTRRPGKEAGRRPDALIETWTSGQRAGIADEMAENLRVYYVAATRARRLLAFAVDQEHVRDLEKYMTANNVPVVVR